LITLPISPAQAATLVHDLVDVFSTPLEISGGGRVAFVFKGHPRLPIRRWLRGRRTLPAWFSVTEDPLSVLWPRVDILLYIPPTASWMEAYAAGVPVVKYCGELLDIDSADRLPSGMVATCSRDTVRSTLERLVVEQTWSVDVSQRRREVIERIFSPVQEDVWVTLARPSPEVNAAA